MSEDLIRDSDKFFELCEQCVGSNFMRVPLSFSRIEGKFSTNFPTWFTPHKASSMAEWLLYFLERAIWLQFKANVEQSNESAARVGPSRNVAAVVQQSESPSEVGMDRLLSQKDSRN